VRPQTVRPRRDHDVDLALSVAWLLGPLSVAWHGVVAEHKPGHLLLAGVGMVAAYRQAVLKIHAWRVHRDGRVDLHSILACITVPADDVLDFELQRNDDLPDSYLVMLSGYRLRRPMRRATAEALRAALGMG
jgi:hypothetical protein